MVEILNLVAFKKLDNNLFRAITYENEEELKTLRESIEKDYEEELIFQVMSEEELNKYLESLPKPPQLPSVEERLKTAEDTILGLMDVIMMGGM